MQYKSLMSELDIKTVRELEDLIIDCMYNDLLKGTLDQKNALLTVEYTFGRDSRAEDVDKMIKQLEDWDTQLGQAETLIERQIRFCNQNIKENYDAQVALEVESQEKRQKLLEAITEGKGEVDGYHIKSGKMGKRDEMGGSGGGGIGQMKDFLSGMAKGFLNKK